MQRTIQIEIKWSTEQFPPQLLFSADRRDSSDMGWHPIVTVTPQNPGDLIPGLMALVQHLAPIWVHDALGEAIEEAHDLFKQDIESLRDQSTDRAAAYAAMARGEW